MESKGETIVREEKLDSSDRSRHFGMTSTCCR